MSAPGRKQWDGHRVRSGLIEQRTAKANQIRTARDKDDRLSQWVTRLAARSHPNVAAAALANETTRMAWAMLRNGTDYQPDISGPTTEGGGLKVRSSYANRVLHRGESLSAGQSETISGRI